VARGPNLITFRGYKFSKTKPKSKTNHDGLQEERKRVEKVNVKESENALKISTFRKLNIHKDNVFFLFFFVVFVLKMQ
jgi:hypothetical protein